MTYAVQTLNPDGTWNPAGNYTSLEDALARAGALVIGGSTIEMFTLPNDETTGNQSPAALPEGSSTP
jgi:hypothetical protein